MTSIDGHREGGTFDHARDTDRLNRQARAVFNVMKDGKWRTLKTIALLTNEPEASVSARLRDLRKPRFGGHVVDRSYVADGIWQYRLEIRQ